MEIKPVQVRVIKEKEEEKEEEELDYIDYNITKEEIEEFEKE